jgi:hypothetical protein
MSLTSYRAAPPRVKAYFRLCCAPFWLGGVKGCVDCMGMRLVFGRPGNDLLSQVLRHSTIGAEEFNGRVRDGIGFRLLATATRPAKDNMKRQQLFDCSPMRRAIGAANCHVKHTRWSVLGSYS